MRANIWLAKAATIAIVLGVLPAGAEEEPANSPEQIKKAQVELKRLDCLTGRIDGKLGDKTRAAMRKFWESAKQPPPADIAITDGLIADLADHGDNYCRPPRHVFFFGGGTKNAGKLPFFAPGGKAAPAPPPALHPPQSGAQ